MGVDQSSIRFTRFSPAIEPRFSFRAEDVVAVLERVGREHGFPKSIRVDQGTEFVSRAISTSGPTAGRHTGLLQARKAYGQQLHREPERQVPGGMPQRPTGS